MVYSDRARETTTTTGTGDITLAGAVSQFQSLNSAFGTNVWFDYAIVGQSGSEWDVGFGYLSASTTLVRAQPNKGSSGDKTLVNFSAGTKDIFNTIGSATINAGIGYGAVIANNFAWR